jgi:hypothetical protein
MAFNRQSFSNISGSGNNRISTLQSGAFSGAPAIYTYINAVDLQATIGASNYFLPLLLELNQGDFIWAIDANGVPEQYLVALVDIPNKTVLLTNASSSAGNVIGPPASTNTAIARFNGITGTSISNSTVLLSNAGDITAVNSIQNAVGTAALPSYTFTGRTNTGLWSSAANTLDFAANAVNQFQVFGTAAAVQWIRAQGGPAVSGLGTATAQFIATAGVGGDANIDVGVKGLGTGGLALIPTASGTAGTLRFWNPAGTFWSAFKAGANTGNNTFIWPLNAPAVNGQVMTFTTAGVGSWSTIPDSSWIDQTATPITMAGNASYVADTAGLLTFNMPAVVAQGTVFKIAGQGAGGWLVQMNAGQTANLNSTPTSVAGSLASSNRYNCIEILCTVANTTFTVIQSQGTIVLA